MIKIKQYKNFYIVDTPDIDKYLTDGVLDLDSKGFKKENKKALKTFNILIRVTKVVNDKQKAKKKLYRFADDMTLIDGLKSLKDEPKNLTALIQSDEVAKEIKEAKKDKAKEVEVVEVKNRILNDVWDEFYNHKINGTDSDLGIWRDNTARTYKSFYNKWIKDTPLGNIPITEVTREDCDALISEIKGKRSLRTATTVIEALRPMFDWYFEKHDINQKNPVPKKKKATFDLKNKRVVKVPLPLVKKLYEVIDNYNDDLFRNVFMWLRTGRRRGEVISLQMEHVDTIDKSFLIEAQNNKADENMEYKLRPELEATLPDEYELEDYLFESPKIKGQPIHGDSVTKHWKSIREKVGGTFKLNGKRVNFAELHLHDLRHIINGFLKEAEVPQEVREKVLGHLNRSTNERYGESYFGDADKAYQLFLDIVYGNVPSDTKWGTV